MAQVVTTLNLLEVHGEGWGEGEPLLSLRRYGLALLAIINAATSQDPPRSAVYQIQSGVYREVGGFAGMNIHPLPYSREAFVSLVIDPGMGAAELTLLDRSKQAVFFRLTNGTVSGGHYPVSLPNGAPDYSELAGLA
jgi:hypothetical protein